MASRAEGEDCMGRSGIPCFGLTTNLDAEAFFKRLAAPMRVLSKKASKCTFKSATYLVLIIYRRRADEAAYYGVIQGRVLGPEHMDC